MLRVLKNSWKDFSIFAGCGSLFSATSCWDAWRSGSQLARIQVNSYIGIPRWCSGKESSCQRKGCRFVSWVGKIPWSRKWQLTSVFLHGKSYGPPTGGLQPMGWQRVDTTEHTGEYGGWGKTLRSNLFNSLSVVCVTYGWALSGEILGPFYSIG